MRFALALALASVFIAPGVALGAIRAQWPSAADIAASEPGVRAQDAACMAGAYRGHLTLAAWRTPWQNLTRAEKIATEAGVTHCMTQDERAAMTERGIASIVGDSPQARCAARRDAARSLAVRLSLTTRASQVASDTRIARACDLVGVLYARMARAVRLSMTPAEQACTNARGTIGPVMRPLAAKVPTAELAAIGRVFDGCVGRRSKEAMYRAVLHDYYPVKALVPCVARHDAATVSFAEYVSQAPSIQAKATRSVETCMAQGA